MRIITKLETGHWTLWRLETGHWEVGTGDEALDWRLGAWNWRLGTGSSLELPEEEKNNKKALEICVKTKIMMLWLQFCGLATLGPLFL